MFKKQLVKFASASMAVSILFSSANGAAFLMGGIAYAAEDDIVFEGDNTCEESHDSFDEESDEEIIVESIDEEPESFDEELNIELNDEELNEEPYTEPSEGFIDSYEEYTDSDFDESGDAIEVDMTATYFNYSPTDMLSEINRIRYEACKEGIIYNGRKLTLSDYKPLKWAGEVEDIAVKRAAEGSMVLGHMSPNLTGAFWYFDSKLFDLYGENLAWNGSTSEIAVSRGVHQFYSEKEEYIKFTKDESYVGVVNHYKNLIAPEYEYVGLSACNTGTAPHLFTTIAMIFVRANEGVRLDESLSLPSGEQTVRICASASRIEELHLDGVKSIKVGDTLKYDLGATLGYSYGGVVFHHQCTIPDDNTEVTWKSSDSSKVLIDSKGIATAKGTGTVTISAAYKGKKAETKLTILGSDNDIDIPIDDEEPGGDTPGDDTPGQDTPGGDSNGGGSADDGDRGGEEIPPENEDGFRDGYGISQDSFTSEFIYDGKKKVQKDLKVYYKDNLLKEKRDYVVSYKNNINAADKNSDNPPTVILTFKGQYTGQLSYTFTILPVDIAAENGAIREEGVVTASSTVTRLPKLVYDSYVLKQGKDYLYSYEEIDTGETTRIVVTCQGTGNFTGTRYTYIDQPLKNCDLSKAVVTVKGDVVTVKIGGKTVSPDYYSYSYDESNLVNTGKVLYEYLTIEPSQEGLLNGYGGTKRVKLKARTSYSFNSKSVDVQNWKDEYIYDGAVVASKGGLYPELSDSSADGVVLKYNDRELILGTDYTVKYSAARSACTVTATFTGLGRYVGSFKKNYKIKPKTEGLGIEYSKAVSYVKGGASPEALVTDSGSGLVLTAGTDYVVKVVSASNKASGKISFYVEGRGNYKGYRSETMEISVMAGDLSKGSMTVADKPYQTTAGAWKAGAIIKDSNGKTLVAGVDYDKKLKYSWDKETPPPAGTTITVTAVGIGNYEGSNLTGIYRIYHKSFKSCIVRIDDKTYIAGRVALSPEDIHVYANKMDEKEGREIDPQYIQIVGYSSNINVGTAKVTLRGLGEYGSTKTCTFKIKRRKMG